MIFKNKLLSSPYDLDQNKMETFSLTSLSKEIYNITQTIYGLYKSGEVIKVENGSKELYLDAGECGLEVFRKLEKSYIEIARAMVHILYSFL